MRGYTEAAAGGDGGGGGGKVAAFCECVGRADGRYYLRCTGDDRVCVCVWTCCYRDVMTTTGGSGQAAAAAAVACVEEVGEFGGGEGVRLENPRESRVSREYVLMCCTRKRARQMHIVRQRLFFLFLFFPFFDNIILFGLYRYD